VIHAPIDAHIVEASGSWEELPEFVEGYRHYSVCVVEGFLDPVAVVDVDVYV
jgi:hypothetical protein